MKIISTILLIVFMAVGCATHGTKFNMADVDTFQPGVTTLDDAKAKLGKPKSFSSMANEETLVQWMYIQASPVHAKSGHVAILFNKDGKMVRVTHRAD